ncbi:MAG: hypothetical protein JSR27_06550, partial [Proteobacteria bacterium]|nr:hypothetical protein [Pseudomonadota bacterium]
MRNRIGVVVRSWRVSVLACCLGLPVLLTALPASAWSPGKDGTLTVTAANTVVNTYTTLNAAAAQNATTITVTNAAALTGLAIGDVLLIYNAQGATIDTTNTASYGTVSSLNNAGRFEFVNVDGISGNTLTIDSGGTANTCGGGLRNNYDNGAQVVRVPQYTTLTISGAGSVVAQAWNGSTGGIVAAYVQNTASVGGAGISVAGQGFRGGALINRTGDPNTDWAAYVNVTADGVGAEKGESIAGYQASYDAIGGRYSRGAPANGGGGGNSHNAGGGGGANGDSGTAWTGEGNTDNSVAGYTTAWKLDPNFPGSGIGASSGGGRGGYTYASAQNDPTTNAPGNSIWGGNNRRERGGIGGRPLTNDPSTAGMRLFFGGGGGSGDENNGAGTAGGNGGGIVFLVAGTISGAGTIDASGATANNNNGLGTGNDAPGGGGGGGSIVLIANGSLSGVALKADGGKGGNQHITTNESEGPGGGGGGGYIAVSGGAPGSRSAVGGVNGTSDSPGLQAKFPPNGATKGGSGLPNAVGPSLSNFPVCAVPALAITKTANGPWIAGQSGAQYTLTVKNNGSIATSGMVTVLDTVPAGVTPPASFSNNGWTCNFASPTLSCTSSAVLAALGGSSSIVVPVTVSPSAIPSVTNNASVGGGGDPNNGGNPPTPGSCAVADPHCASTTTPVSGVPALTVAKTGPATATVGTAYNYVITVTNTGTAATTAATTVTDTV